MIDFLLSVFALGPATITDGELDRLESLRPIYERLGKEHGVPPALLAAIGSRESRNRADAVNPRTKAQGLMQIMPANFEAWGIPQHQWHDPETNIRAAIQVLKDARIGERPLEDVLMHYGGFRGAVEGPEDDPGPYIREVIAKATRLATREGFTALV